MRYFLVTYYKQPTGKINESVKVDTKVRMKDLQSASVIIDYKERKIVKSNFEEELGPGRQHDFDTINDFYKSHYPQVISQLEAKYEVLNAALEMVKSDLGKAAEENPDVIKDEIDKDIVDKLKKIADDVS
jgi:hypothetical protein